MHRHLRSYICKLRCGTLPLAIETGRFNKPPIPLNERTCPFNFCYNTVEDEVHFLIDCDIYSGNFAKKNIILYVFTDV
jgi:hypothetical protein